MMSRFKKIREGYVILLLFCFTLKPLYATCNETTASTITVESELSSFIQVADNPSPAQTYVIAASNLTTDLIITPPPSFEISIDGGISWHTHTSPLTLSHTGGVLSPTNVSIRLNAVALGSYSGNIIHASTGIENLTIPLTGITLAATPPPSNAAVTVAKDGTGNYTTVQAAINAAPTGQTMPYVIYIKNGIYKEKINIPSNKPFLQLVGESVANTILTFDDYSGKSMPGGGTFGTSNSASVTVNAANFSALNITFENSTGDAPQALAINVNADRAAFKNCRFLGGQDTMLTNGAGNRQNYRNCYIDGVVDFIFGEARAVFDSCIVYARSRLDNGSGGYITAANTKAEQQYGYVFRNCTLPSNTGVTKYVLGRPWQNSCGSSPVSYPRVVFINSLMGYTIKPEGWSVWDACTNTASIYYGEYKSKTLSGAPANISQRVPWSFQLTDEEAALYTNTTLFNTWDPCTVAPDFCTYEASPLAVSNFKARKGITTSTISWNLSWPSTGVTFELFRSSDNISFTKINQQSTPNDTTINFSFVENIPAPGVTYYYFVVASKAGKSPHKTGTMVISSTPTITTTGSLSNFLQGASIPSATQAYQVSGVNLTDPITITPPMGFEVSTNGTTWYTSSTPLVLAHSGNSVSPTPISVRMNAPSTGQYSGNIVHQSTGAAPINIVVSGEAQADPLPVSHTLLYWPLTNNNLDDANLRSAGVAASSPTLKRLFLSNGTTVTSVPAYSSTNGQAFSPAENGEGLWTTASGGPGGTLNRKFYEQFTITALPDSYVRVDSIIIKGAYYNSASNTRFAIVYSKSGFTLGDSTDITGGIGPDGVPLLSSANGAFSTPVLLTNETNGTTRTYRFSLAGATGIFLDPGETLTLRMYFSCGSTSTGRYAKLKDVYIKGFTEQAHEPAITIIQSLTTFHQIQGSPSESQVYTITGTHLSENITITPPLNFELSTDGITWNATPFIVTTSHGTTNATIHVRLNANAPGSYTGMISHTGSGLSVNVGVEGMVEAITATGENAAQGFSIRPNPVNDELIVHHKSLHSSLPITIYHITGVKVSSSLLNIGTNSTNLSTRYFPNGLYFIEYFSEQERKAIRFIVQH